MAQDSRYSRPQKFAFLRIIFYLCDHFSCKNLTEPHNMDKNFKRTLVTTALPYANGPVHIGHLAGVYVPAT